MIPITCDDPSHGGATVTITPTISYELPLHSRRRTGERRVVAWPGLPSVDDHPGWVPPVDPTVDVHCDCGLHERIKDRILRRILAAVEAGGASSVPFRFIVKLNADKSAIPPLKAAAPPTPVSDDMRARLQRGLRTD